MAALRIVFDVAWFRLRRLEMANLGAAGALLITLHAAWADVLVRGLAGALLNLLVYLNNDYHDLAADLEADSMDQKKNRFLDEHLGSALFAQIAMLALENLKLNTQNLFGFHRQAAGSVHLDLGYGVQCTTYRAKRAPREALPTLVTPPNPAHIQNQPVCRNGSRSRLVALTERT